MDNSLRYEKLNVSAASDIEKAYKDVVTNNKKYYRCKTASGKIIGWNAANNRFIPADKAKELYPDTLYIEDGDIWFINPDYVEPPVFIPPVTSEERVEAVKAETHNEAVDNVEPPKQPVEAAKEEKTENPSPVQEKPNIAPIENIKRSVEETTNVFADMMTRYTNICNELDEEKQKVAERDKTIAELKKRVEKAEKRAAELDDEEDSAADRLDELKEAIRTFVEFCRGAANER